VNPNADPSRADPSSKPQPRVALVTGGGAGIGAAISKQLAEAGYIVFIGDIDPHGARDLAGILCKAGHEAYGTQLDVSSPSSIDAVFDAIDRQFGRCDVLVNNAGIAKTFPFLDYPVDHWRKVFDVNVTGPMLCGQRAARLMCRNHWGRIVNIASVSGLRASSGRTAYGTSKAAVVGLTRQMAIELAEYGITTNSVAPGPIDTPMTRDLHSQIARDNYTRAVPAGRYGAPEEIAAVVRFLCSSEASYVNGQTVPVDGGFMAAGVLEI
jgi:3-oxoacyl-[acyl-carrier protein] reductase